MAEGMDDSLFGFLRMLCKGLEGQSKSLDSNLSKLRSHMIVSTDEIPEKLINDIEQDLRILHLERQDTSQDFLGLSNDWHKSLKAQSLDTEQKKLLAQVGNDFTESCSNLYLLPAKLNALLDLQLIVNDLKENGVSAEGDDHSEALKKVSNEMIQLLSQLNVPAECRSVYRELVDEIEENVFIDKLPNFINRITKIVEVVLGSKSEDFENYLQGLNEQLSEVQSFISNTQIMDSDSAVERSKADEQVRDSVVTIRNSVNNVGEISNLKQSVSVQLTQIVGAMDTLKSEELKRETSLQESYDALKKRVSVMERDAEKVQDYIEDERKKAREDALTGLPNRAAYNDIMTREIEDWKRYSNPLSLVICDLDYFKKVNDTYGHLAGDKVLNLIAKILCKGTRTSDFVTRYGGEEFAVILPSTSAKEAKKAMEKIRLSICKSPFNYHGKPIEISMSFGISETISGDDIESLFCRSDAALYRAKAQGRNCVCIG